MATTTMNSYDASPFREDQFPPVPERASEYYQAVQQGKQAMNQLRVVLAGLARNTASALPCNMLRAESLGNHFADYRVFIYENDSSDATPQLLDAWQRRNDRVTIQSESLGDQPHRPTRCLHRADRMAFYRGQCQSQLLNRWPDFDAVILIDWDVAGGWSLDGIATTFARQDWDFVGSNGLICKRLGLRPNCLLHYDAWAFRVDDDFRPLTTKAVNRIHYHRGQPFVPVTSCFGGLGVYRMPAFQAGKYAGGDIEHVAMHRSMREQGFGRLFLNPSQIVHYGRRHRSRDRLVHQCQQWASRVGLKSQEWDFPLPSENTSYTSPSTIDFPQGSTAIRNAG